MIILSVFGRLSTIYAVSIVAVVAITDTTTFALVVAGVFTVDFVASNRVTKLSLGGISAGDISLGLDVRRGFSDGIGESIANESDAKKGKPHFATD